jgi:hypothetical protein
VLQQDSHALNPPDPLNPPVTTPHLTSQAFTAISTTLAGLTSAQVTSVLTYHVSPVLLTVPFTAGTVPTLLSGQSLRLVAPR